MDKPIATSMGLEAVLLTAEPMGPWALVAGFAACEDGGVTGVTQSRPASQKRSRRDVLVLRTSAMVPSRRCLTLNRRTRSATISRTASAPSLALTE